MILNRVVIRTPYGFRQVFYANIQGDIILSCAKTPVFVGLQQSLNSKFFTRQVLDVCPACCFSHRHEAWSYAACHQPELAPYPLSGSVLLTHVGQVAGMKSQRVTNGRCWPENSWPFCFWRNRWNENTTGIRAWSDDSFQEVCVCPMQTSCPGQTPGKSNLVTFRRTNNDLV